MRYWSACAPGTTRRETRCPNMNWRILFSRTSRLTAASAPLSVFALRIFIDCLFCSFLFCLFQPQLHNSNYYTPTNRRRLLLFKTQIGHEMSSKHSRSPIPFFCKKLGFSFPFITLDWSCPETCYFLSRVLLKRNETYQFHCIIIFCSKDVSIIESFAHLKLTHQSAKLEIVLNGLEILNLALR